MAIWKDENFLSGLEKQYKLPTGLVKKMIQTESSGNPNATSRVGAQGLMQLMPGTAKDLGVSNAYDPVQNLQGGAKYIGRLLGRYNGDQKLALMAYNWGMGNVDAYRKTGLGIKGQPVPLEAQQYAGKVLGGNTGFSGGSGGQGQMQPKSSNDIQGRIAKAKQAGYTDEQIYGELAKNQQYANRFTKARQHGYTDDQIYAELGLNVKSSQPIQSAQPVRKPFKAVDPRLEAEKQVAREEGPTKLWESALLGASDLGAGVLQGFNYAGDKVGEGINKALGTNIGTGNYEAFTKQREEIERSHNQRREVNGQGFDVGRLAGQVAATAPMAAAARGLQGAKLASAAGAKFLSQNAAVGAGIAGTSFAKDADTRASNMLAGGLGGAAGGVIGEKVLRPIMTKMVNIATGRLKPDAQEIVDLGDKHGIRTSVGDAGQNPHVKRAEVGMEQIPVVGTAGFRAGQQTEAKTAANKAVNDLQQTMQAKEFKGMAPLQAAAASGDRNAARILKIMDKAGNDSSKIIQAGAEVRLWREGKVSKNLFNIAQDKAKAQGGAVTPTNYSNLLNQEIGKINQSLAPNDPLLSELTRIQSRLNDPAIVKDFANMRLLRSELGNTAEGFMAGSNPNKQAAKIIGDLREAVENDIRAYATGSGNRELADAYIRADRFYANSLKNRDSNIAKALKSDKTDEIYDQFIMTGRADRASNFYRSLDPKAQAALRYEMANIALDKATNPSTQVFSPANFAREFEKMRDPYASVFKGADKKEMDGLVKLMRHIERAGQYAENPANGSRLLLPTAAGAAGMAAVNNPLGAIGGVGSIWGVKTLLTTKYGKQILLAAADADPNSQVLNNLLKRAHKLSVNVGANQAKSFVKDKQPDVKASTAQNSVTLTPEQQSIYDEVFNGKPPK